VAGVVDGATVVLVVGTAVTVVVGPFGPVVQAKCVVGAVVRVVDVMGCRTATYMCAVVVVWTALVFVAGTVVGTVVGTVLVCTGLVVTVAGAPVVVGKSPVGTGVLRTGVLRTGVLGTGAVEGTDALVVGAMGLEVVALAVDLPPTLVLAAVGILRRRTRPARPPPGRVRWPWLKAGRLVVAGTVVLVATVEVTVDVVSAGRTGRGRTVVVVGPAAKAILLVAVMLGGGGVAAWTARTPPAVNAAAPTATCVVVIKACPATPNLANSGTSATQETGPTTQRRRPIETFRSALTMAGSNWLPAQRVSSWRAATGLNAFLYERTAVMTSKASATATIRAPSEISSPDKPKG
jgi:hypothetical protein